MGTAVALNLIDLPIFERRVVPAYSLYAASSDASGLVTLAKNAIAEYPNVVGKVADLPSIEVYEEYLNILTGKVFYRSDGTPHDQLRETTPDDLRLLIDNSIAPALMRLMCIPYDLPAVEQNMSHRQLMMYLYDHSRFVEDHFTFAIEPSGSTPPIKLGEWSRFFSADEVRKLDQELARIPIPEDRDVLNGGFDNLRSLVHTAVQQPQVGLLLTVL
jgi:hypothetical protein